MVQDGGSTSSLSQSFIPEEEGEGGEGQHRYQQNKTSGLPADSLIDFHVASLAKVPN